MRTLFITLSSLFITSLLFIHNNIFIHHSLSNSDTPVSELSLELLLLQVILPALLEQGHTRVWLKLVVRHWCVAVSHILGLRSYLLGDVPLDPQVGSAVGICGSGVGV